MYLDGNIHGETKKYCCNGWVYKHSYVINNEIIVDLRNISVSDEEKVFLKLKYGGDWLPK